MNNGSPGEQLTEFEQVKMENFALKHTALQQQVQTNLMERRAFVEKIEAAHPGWQWSEQGGLVKTAERVAAPPPVPQMPVNIAAKRETRR